MYFLFASMKKTRDRALTNKNMEPVTDQCTKIAFQPTNRDRPEKTLGTPLLRTRYCTCHVTGNKVPMRDSILGVNGFKTSRKIFNINLCATVSNAAEKLTKLELNIFGCQD